jgi:hypothetical protein
MSHIFDALQRAESESTGAESSTFSLATELLQAAEKKIRDADAAVDPRSADLRSADPRSAEPRRAESFDSQEPVSSADALDTPDRCPVLPFSIPQDSRLVSVGEEESLGAEKFRFLAVRFRQLRQSRPLKKILITSTIPQEGWATFLAFASTSADEPRA